MTGFILKVKTKHGQDILKTLGPFSTIGVLKQELSKIAKIPVTGLCVLCGFPPKQLDLSVDNNTLESHNIFSGDTILVQEKFDPLQEEESVIKEHLHQCSEDCGVLLKKTVPPDNSCLFTSIAFALWGKVDSNCAVYMRQIISEAIANDPDTYSEAILGRPNKDYCQWIEQSTSWGGAIELAILSQFYEVEIVVVDSVNGILNRFGEDHSYDYRILLFFDGVHYDPLYLQNCQDYSSKTPETKFHTSDERILQKAETLSKEAKASRQFTDVDRFTLHCQECNIFLKGQTEAVKHAKETGHQNFGEVDSN